MYIYVGLNCKLLCPTRREFELVPLPRHLETMLVLQAQSNPARRVVSPAAHSQFDATTRNTNDGMGKQTWCSCASRDRALAAVVDSLLANTNDGS